MFQILIYLTVSLLRNNVLFEKRTKNFLKVLRGKTLRKLCCARSFSRCARHHWVSSSSAAKDLGRNSLEDDAFGLRATHNDFLPCRKSVICCLNNRHMKRKWLCLVVANYSFVFICEHKTLARVLPESSAVICARFSRISTNFTATITKCLKKLFAPLFAKSGIILLFVTNR